MRQALQRRPWQHGCTNEPCGKKRAGSCPARVGGGLVLVQPKSRAGRRTVTLPKPLIRALRDHRDRQSRPATCGATTGTSSSPSRVAVPPTRPATGQPGNASSNRPAFRTPASTTPATAATPLLAQGVPARVAMEILGHSQIGLTLGTYSHVVPEMRRDAADRIGDALWGNDASDDQPDGDHATEADQTSTDPDDTDDSGDDAASSAPAA